MKILVFTEGTLLMHSAGVGKQRKEIVKQVQSSDPTVKDYSSYVPIGRAQTKLKIWVRQGGSLYYLTSRRTAKEIEEIQTVLDRYSFPKGELVFRKNGEEYKDVIERVSPDVLVEDDCESIGGENEMTYPHIKPEMKKEIKSVVIQEFSGIDSLPGGLDTFKV